MLTPSKKMRQTFFAQPSSTRNDWPIDCDTQLHTPIFRPWHWNRKMVRLSGPFYGGLPALFRFASYYFCWPHQAILVLFLPSAPLSCRRFIVDDCFSGRSPGNTCFFLSFVLRQQKHCRLNITHTCNTHPKNEKTACRDYSFSRDLPRRIWPPHEGCMSVSCIAARWCACGCWWRGAAFDVVASWRTRSKGSQEWSCFIALASSRQPPLIPHVEWQSRGKNIMGCEWHCFCNHFVVILRNAKNFSFIANCTA